MKILFIPAGGYSQRLPNLTALGKLFCPLPFGDENYHMLDLILATYLPFLENMQPGVFLVSSDAIISYNLNQDDNWTFWNEGFTALAHPSPISVGCNHGIYVLPPSKDQDTSSSHMRDCLQVLQKPSIEEIYERGAVTSIKIDADKQEIVFSDSAYFFDHNVSMKLRKFYDSNKPLKYELNSYGDFLQPLGIKATPSYILKVQAENEPLAITKAALYRNLNGTKLSILVLQQSNFHHLGTMIEYLDSLCFKNKFSKVFPVSRFSFSSCSVKDIIPLYVQGTVMHSIVNPMSNICENTLVEYSDFSIAMDIGENCIISNIQLQGFPVQRLPYKIPQNTLLHTAAVTGGFVTIACNIYDDIKRIYASKDSFDVEFFGKRLKATLALNVDCFTQNCNNISLWNAKIFPVKHTAKESFLETLRIISCQTDDGLQDIYYKLDDECVKLISMGDIVYLKDTDKMIQYQQKLYYKIKQML